MRCFVQNGQGVTVCIECGNGKMKWFTDLPCEYDDSDLNITLYGVSQLVCDNCGILTEIIPDTGELIDIVDCLEAEDDGTGKVYVVRYGEGGWVVEK